jgi:cell division protease FtsH
MCSALGGRAAEQLIFGKISTGALSDLEKVTKQAYAMVSIYGLNERVGNISYYDSQGRDSFTKPYSDVTARVIDEEVSKLIESQYQRALETLRNNQDKLTQLAEKLLETEVIFKEDLELIFGKRTWEPEEMLGLEIPKEKVVKTRKKKAVAAPEEGIEKHDVTVETIELSEAPKLDSEDKETKTDA